MFVGVDRARCLLQQRVLVKCEEHPVEEYCMLDTTGRIQIMFRSQGFHSLQYVPLCHNDYHEMVVCHVANPSSKAVDREKKQL